MRELLARRREDGRIGDAPFEQYDFPILGIQLGMARVAMGCLGRDAAEKQDQPSCRKPHLLSRSHQEADQQNGAREGKRKNDFLRFKIEKMAGENATRQRGAGQEQGLSAHTSVVPFAGRLLSSVRPAI